MRYLLTMSWFLAHTSLAKTMLPIACMRLFSVGTNLFFYYSVQGDGHRPSRCPF